MSLARTLTAPATSCLRFGWVRYVFTKNGPSSPGLATGAYEFTKHVGGLHGICSKFWGLPEYASSKSDGFNIIY